MILRKIDPSLTFWCYNLQCVKENVIVAEGFAFTTRMLKIQYCKMDERFQHDKILENEVHKQFDVTVNRLQKGVELQD